MPKKMDEVFGIQEIKENRMPLFKSLVAEFLGLVLLVFFGCGAANAAARALGSRNVEKEGLPSDFITHVSLAFGLTIAGTAQAIGHISGGHINPAVTLGILVSGKLSLLRAVLYMIAQFIGGIVGAALLKAVVPVDAALNWPANHLGANGLQGGVEAYQGFIVEAMVTFILVFVVYGCCDGRRDDVKGSIPLAIGLTVTVAHLLSIPFTGAGLNPARTLGPAILTGKYDDLWVYFVGPFLGAAIAGILYTVLFKAKRPTASEDF